MQSPFTVRRRQRFWAALAVFILGVIIVTMLILPYTQHYTETMLSLSSFGLTAFLVTIHYLALGYLPGRARRGVLANGGRAHVFSIVFNAGLAAWFSMQLSATALYCLVMVAVHVLGLLNYREQQKSRSRRVQWLSLSNT